ncbi:MAG: hypothetical protein ACHREM_01060 [Polyangiales bacterium]
MTGALTNQRAPYFVPVRSRTTKEIVDETRARATVSYEALRTSLLTKSLDQDVTFLHDYVLGKLGDRDEAGEVIDRILAFVTLALIHGLDAKVPPEVPQGSLMIYDLLRAASARWQAQNDEPVMQRYLAALLGKSEMTISKLCKEGTLPRSNQGVDPRTVQYLVEKLDHKGDEAEPANEGAPAKPPASTKRKKAR